MDVTDEPDHKDGALPKVQPLPSSTPALGGIQGSSWFSLKQDQERPSGRGGGIHFKQKNTLNIWNN